MIDERLVRALAGIIRAGGTHQRACLIGGQALRDLYHALQARLGEIPAVRTSEDLDLLGHLGPTCGYLACLVFLLYIAGDTATSLYQRPALLWLVAPLFLYWITRVWFLAHRGELSDDPLVFAVKDRHTYVIGLMVAVLVVLAV